MFLVSEIFNYESDRGVSSTPSKTLTLKTPYNRGLGVGFENFILRLVLCVVENDTENSR